MLGRGGSASPVEMLRSGIAGALHQVFDIAAMRGMHGRLCATRKERARVGARRGDVKGLGVSNWLVT
jgi:hypothetical protein